MLTSQTHTYISSVECDTRLKSLALGPLAALAPDKNFLRDKRWRFVYTRDEMTDLLIFKKKLKVT